VTTGPAKGVYHCAECGHWRNLRAYAAAVVYGPLGADGDLECYSDIDDYEVEEDSIQCTEHPDAALEKFTGGAWCRWWQCPTCQGRGRVHVGEHWKAPDGYPCRDGIEVPGKHGPRKIHAGWRPAGEFAPSSSDEGAS
jgi:hypothetical protein